MIFSSLRDYFRSISANFLQGRCSYPRIIRNLVNAGDLTGQLIASVDLGRQRLPIAGSKYDVLFS